MITHSAGDIAVCIHMKYMTVKEAFEREMDRERGGTEGGVHRRIASDVLV